MDKNLGEAQQDQDKQWQLEIQRELAYQQSLEEDEWVDGFFDSIKKSSDPTSFEILKQHISDSARLLMHEEFKEWEDQYNKSSSSSSALSTPLT